MRLPSAALAAIGFAVCTAQAGAQSAAPGPDQAPPAAKTPAPCAVTGAVDRTPHPLASASCEAALRAGSSADSRGFGWMVPFGSERRAARRFRLDGTSTYTSAPASADAPAAVPSSADRWRMQQTLTYRAGLGIELQAGISASHGADWPLSLQQVDAPNASPFGGFGVEPRSLDTTGHTSFGLRKALSDGTRTFTPFGEAIDVIPISRDANDPAAKASRPARVRVGGTFGF